MNAGLAGLVEFDFFVIRLLLYVGFSTVVLLLVGVLKKLQEIKAVIAAAEPETRREGE